MKLDKQLAKGSHELILLKLLSRQDMYGYQLIQSNGAFVGGCILHESGKLISISPCPGG